MWHRLRPWEPARLGQGLFCAGCVFAMLIVLAGLLLFSGMQSGDLVLYATLTAIAAGLIFLIGYEARYILQGGFIDDSEPTYS
jgi:hypothetical protein